jgi:predicted dehydrogenase
MAAVHGLAARALGLPVTLVAARQPTRAAERAAQLGARPCTPEALPGGADCVVVATPPSAHAGIARRALAAGAAVLVETPLCETLAEADELVAEAQTSGNRLVYGENLVHAPIVAAAREQIRTLGRLVHLEARALGDRAGASATPPDPVAPTVLVEPGVHPIALVLLVAAPARVVEVSGHLRRAEAGPGDHAVVRLRFDDGLDAFVEAGGSPGGAAWDLQAASERGVVRLELVPTLGLERDGEPLPLPPHPATPAPIAVVQFGYLSQLAHLAEVAAGRSTPLVGADFGREVLEVVHAAHASAARDGSPEALPFRGPRDRPLSAPRGR